VEVYCLILIGDFPFVLFNLKEVKIQNFQEKSNINVNSNMLFIYFLAFFYMLIFFILPTQIPFLIIEKFKASGSLTSMIIATAFFCNALGAISFFKLKNRFNISKTILITYYFSPSSRYSRYSRFLFVNWSFFICCSAFCNIHNKIFKNQTEIILSPLLTQELNNSPV
jgi:hypothetical protein